MEVTFAMAEERNMILGNSHKLIGSGIYVREDLSLVNYIKKRAAKIENNLLQQRNLWARCQQSIHKI